MVQIIDINGKKVAEYNFNGTTQVDAPMDRLVPGTYLLRINNTVSKIVQKQ
jgi:hypothetical protein